MFTKAAPRFCKSSCAQRGAPLWKPATDPLREPGRMATDPRPPGRGFVTSSTSRPAASQPVINFPVLATGQVKQ